MDDGSCSEKPPKMVLACGRAGGADMGGFAIKDDPAVGVGARGGLPARV